MPQVALQHATIDYHELGPADSAHPPVLFVHGILVDRRLLVDGRRQRLARTAASAASCRTAAGFAHDPGQRRHRLFSPGRRDDDRAN